MAQTPNRNAFTLMEMSLVLVIIGLLVGGILSGQALIRSSQIRSVITDYSKFVTAVNAFQAEFNALPGDMMNATSYWGAAHATPATCVTTQGTGTQTCDGNGDGLIASSTGSAEPFRFWQQLANAGLIEGSFTGVKADVAAISNSSANSPTSKVPSGLWHSYNWGPLTVGGVYFNGDYYNTLVYAGYSANASPSAGIFLPEEMYNIDVKLDDGKPGIGKIWVGRFATCTNTTDKTAFLTADYKLDYKVKDCFLFSPNIFYRNN